MNWDAIGAIAETVGTLAVLVTLVYLAIQLRVSNKQREIESYRHNLEGLNTICGILSESTEKTSRITSYNVCYTKLLRFRPSRLCRYDSISLCLFETLSCIAK